MPKKKFTRTLENGPYQFYKNYINNARKRKLDFDLSQHDFSRLTNSNCHYCGSSPRVRIRKYKTREVIYLANGIDRVDSVQGYHWDNCVACCTMCNMAKNGMPYHNFIQYLDQLVKFRTKKETDET